MISLNKLAKMVLVGLLLFGVTAFTPAGASENQADSTTKLKVKLALLEKLGTDSLHVEVDANEGDLILRGMVDKRETAELATSVSKSVSGVKSVKNEIVLEAMEANPSKAARIAGEAEAEVKDSMLATKIRIALVDKMGADGFKIGTVAANGVVTLRFGSEFAVARRNQASKIAKDVVGVHKVISVHKT